MVKPHLQVQKVANSYRTVFTEQHIGKIKAIKV